MGTWLLDEFLEEKKKGHYFLVGIVTKMHGKMILKEIAQSLIS